MRQYMVKSMLMNGHGQHHLHVRKRMYENLEPFPHPEAAKRFLDRIMVFVAAAGPLAMLPQVFDVLFTRSVEGLSLTTWSLWTGLSVIWLFYGILHRELPIIVSNTLYLGLHGIIVGGILLYGGTP